MQYIAIFFLQAFLSVLPVRGGQAPEADYRVIPLPEHIDVSGSGFFILDDGTKIVRGEGVSEKDAAFLLDYIRETSGIECSIASKARRNAIFLSVMQDSEGNPEGYEIVVDKSGIHICGNSSDGLFHGIQTVRKSLPAGRYGEVVFPYAVIRDAPRFPYRAMHLDVSRHFFDKDFVKKYIDLLALHNMNYFHWHLTDDQGWRIEIRKYPLLAEKSCRRDYTVIRRDYDRNDGTPYGEGCYYTQDDIREIVQYALDRHIQIIPEIDMPGHMLAALASYPEFGCSGGPYKVWTRWGVSDQVLCAGNDATVQFAKDVLSEVAELFPCRYIHIGGDECPKTEWRKCPRCQARIAAEGILQGNAKSVEDALQGWFMKEMSDFLASKGKTVIGWDELLESGAADNDMVVMSWRGTSGGISAAKQHTNAIMVPHSYLYFDYYQTEDRSQEPFAAGGKVTVEKVFNYDPFDGIPPEYRKYILGVQANLWTEFIPDPKHAEYMVIPRIDALSEVQWHETSAEEYPDFLQRLRRQIALYDLWGYNYARYVL